MTTTGGSPFYADVQGLRGVAVVLVVLYHGVGWPFSGGLVGVDIFFVISGFLITGLLVRERERTGSIKFIEFYARRARRLLPAVTVVTLTTLLVGWVVLAPGDTSSVASSALAAAFYVSNIVFAARSADYIGGDLDADPFLHTWSLGVEEQFYLVWPLVVWIALAIPRRRSMSSLWTTFTLLAGISFVACVYLTWTNRPWAFFGMPLRAWEFALGALAWLTVAPGTRHPAPGAQHPAPSTPSAPGAQHPAPSTRNAPSTREAPSARLSWIGAVLMVVGIAVIDAGSAFPGWIAAVPAVGAALVLVAGRAEAVSWPTRALGWRPLVWLGDLSYSWYLWHWPLLVFSRVLFGDGIVPALTAVVASLGLAQLTYMFVENPVRTDPRLAARPVWSVGGALALSVVASVAALGTNAIARAEMSTPAQLAYSRAATDDPPVYEDGCHASFWSTDHPPCTYAVRDSPRRIVLFGDSHAAHWFPAIDELATTLDAELVTLTKSSCPSVAVPLDNAVLRRKYVECETWRNRILQRIVESTPQLVIISNFADYDVLGDGSRPTRIAPEDWADGLRAVLARFREAGIPVIVIRDTPKPYVPVPSCLSRSTRWNGDDTDCRFPATTRRRTAIADVERAAVASSGAGVYLDLSRAICPTETCDVERDGYVLFRDDNHLTATFSRSLAPRIRSTLEVYARDGGPGRLKDLLSGDQRTYAD